MFERFFLMEVMDSSAMVQEGFLCPMCMKDLGDFVQLQQHFSDVHTDKEDVFFPIKGFFDKAKQRLMKFELNREVLSEVPSTVTSYSIVEPVFVEPQDLGVTVNHTAYFKKVRDTKIDNFAVETNKLIIRLDKLINEAPTDPSKRKAFEKEIIPWVNDSEVQNCRFCGCKFSLAKRKHHCRLCGKIICGSCSKFLTFAYARKLTNPAFAVAYQLELEQQKAQTLSQSKQTSPNLPLRQAERLLMNSLSMLKRDGSEVSVSSLFNQHFVSSVKEGEEHLRICKECRDLLDKRDQQVEQRTQAPVIVQMYDRLRLLMEEAERLLPSYCKMAESLCGGESLYDLQTAKDLRVKIIKLQEQIDFTSKRIGQFGVDNDDNVEPEAAPTNVPLSARQMTLQRNVQAFAAAFLRDMVLSMPNLPQDGEYAELQSKHKAGLEHKINRERSAAAAAVLRANDTNVRTSPMRKHSAPLPQQKLSWKSEEAGWTPSRAALTSTLSSLSFSSDGDQPNDPLREQILLIKGFIRQAAVDGRLDEVRILEKNLNELECELKRQQQLSTTEHERT